MKNINNILKTRDEVYKSKTNSEVKPAPIVPIKPGPRGAMRWYIDPSANLGPSYTQTNIIGIEKDPISIIDPGMLTPSGINNP
jgi:hypothetical protein